VNSQNCERRLLAAPCLSVHVEQLCSHWTDFHEILYFSIFFFRKSGEKIHVLLKSDKNNGYFTWRRVCVYDNISLSFYYIEKCFTQKLQRKSEPTFYVQWLPPPPENRAVCRITWKNMAEPDRSQMTIRRMRFACWITKATHTHSEYAILIAFPWKQCLRESA
jgi:hypothetical protein